MPGDPARGAYRFWWAFVFPILIAGLGSPANSEPSIVAFTPIIEASTPPWRFKVAFWRDPDLSDALKERLDYRIYLLANNLKESLGSDLIQCGYRDIEIYFIDDYRDLLSERGKGEFHLLHCDPAAYLMGRLYPSPGFENWDPYDQILEEVPPEDSDERACGIWVQVDSEIQSIDDLREGAHVAAVDGHCLLGGVLQKAALASPISTFGGGFHTTDCGSVSDAILRLITGFATDQPIEAAFLPLRSPGVQKARRMLALRRGENLPIRLLEKFDGSDLPGNTLLASRVLDVCGPAFKAKITRFFLSQDNPWKWRTPESGRFENLERKLAPLFGRGEESP